DRARYGDQGAARAGTARPAAPGPGDRRCARSASRRRVTRALGVALEQRGLLRVATLLDRGDLRRDDLAPDADDDRPHQDPADEAADDRAGARLGEGQAGAAREPVGQHEADQRAPGAAARDLAGGDRVLGHARLVGGVAHESPWTSSLPRRSRSNWATMT